MKKVAKSVKMSKSDVSVIDEVRKIRRGQPKLLVIGFRVFRRLRDGSLQMEGAGIPTSV